MYPVFDLHCDTLSECKKRGCTLYKNDLHVDLCKLKKIHSYAQCFAIFIDRMECKEQGISPYEKYREILDFYREELRKYNDILVQVNHAEELCENYRAGKISAILTVEGGEVLEGKPEYLEQLYRDGVKVLTLTWNYENELAYPNGSDRGLKPFGYEIVERMNDLGMIIDVSHLSDRGFYEVLAKSRKPVAATHSCARALCDHPRNMTDDMLHKLGENGGIIGLNFYSRFLKAGSSASKMEQVLAHAKHIVSHAGIDALALGSDFDGIVCGLEWKDCAGMQELLEFLSGYFSEAEMEKITYRNAERFWGKNENKDG